MNLSYKNKRILKIYHSLPYYIREWVGFLYSLKLHRRRFGGVFTVQLNDLVQNEKLSQEERKVIQLGDLKEMLIYAGEATPYYRELFSKIGFDPQSIQSLDEIRKIPPLEKKVLRTQREQLLAESFKSPTMDNYTSGTTGSALKITLSEEANQRHYACLHFHFGWVGFRKGEPIATFGGHPVAAMDRMTPPFWLYDRKENELFFSPDHLTPKTVSSYVRELTKFSPKVIRGYPSLIYLIALHILETGKREIHPKGIFTYSETTLDKQRQAIEQAFGCLVYSSYGTGERVGHLLQCSDGNFHEVTESGVIEVLRPNGEPATSGEIGELVITSLINKAMPMIRYRVGDTGVQMAGLCKCGRTSPILKEIIGRSEDFIVTPDGRHLFNLEEIFLSTPNIKEAQLVQEKIDFLLVNIVTRPTYNEEDEKLLYRALRSYLGHDIEIQVKDVDVIPRTPQGKFRFVVSKVPIQFRGLKTNEPL